MKIREDKIADGLKDVEEYIDENKQTLHKVNVPVDIDVKRVRSMVNMTQKEFANEFGFTISAIRNWEQGRRKPEGPASILLKLISSAPDVVQNLLKEKPA